MKYPTMLGQCCFGMAFAFCLLFSSQPGWAQARSVTGTQTRQLEHDQIQGGKVQRAGNVLLIEPKGHAAAGSVRIPRFFASLKSLGWVQGSGEIALRPDPAFWTLSWKDRSADAAQMRIEFHSAPLLTEEIRPLTAGGDGSIVLPASAATTHGEKIRFEPQQHKNTVGYWVGKQDFARWTIQLDQRGRFNLGVLQGCGKNQGGSEAEIRFLQAGKPVALLSLEVLETGHFQDFRWRHAGAIDLPAGEIVVEVHPKRIAAAALMDVRQLHLIRLPK